MEYSLVILAGGKGTRLGKITEGLQKCAVTVADKPFIAHIIEKFLTYQPKKIIIAAGYRSEDLENILASFGNQEIELQVENEPKGTGGALLSILKEIQTSVVAVVNGDTFFDFDLGQILPPNFSSQVMVMCGTPEVQSTSGSIHSQDGLIYKKFDTENENINGIVFSGFALFKLDFLQSISPRVCALEEIINKSNSTTVRKNLGRFWDIGTPDGLSRTIKYMEKNKW